MQAARLACLSRDGVHYIQFAQQLAEDPSFYLKAQLSQPGYSLALLGTQRLLGARLATVPALEWERSGQLIAIVAGVMIVPLVYLLSARLFDRRTGLVAAGMATIWPHAIELSADVLTDMLHLALYLAAVVVAEHAIRRGRVARLPLVGAMIGLAYLVRQEAFGALLATAAAWVWLAPNSRIVRAIGLLSMLIGFAMPTLPYVVMTGRLFHKKSIEQLIEKPSASALPRSSGTRLPILNGEGRDPEAERAAVDVAFASTTGGEIGRAALSALEGWARSGRYVFSTLALVGMLWPAVGRSRQDARRFVALLAGIHVAAVLLRGRSFGDVSIRYMVVPVALSLPWAAAAILVLWTDVARWFGARGQTARGVLLAIVLLPLVVRLRVPPNAGWDGLRRTGEWLRANAGPGDVVTADPQLDAVCFYAGLKRVRHEDFPPDERWAALLAGRPRWFIDQADAKGPPADAATVQRSRAAFGLLPPAYETTGGDDRALRVYPIRGE